MFCGLKAQSNIGPYNDDGLACKVNMFYRVWLPPLVLDVFEDTELSHDIGHSVKELLVVLTYLAFPFLVHDIIVRCHLNT